MKHVDGQAVGQNDAAPGQRSASGKVNWKLRCPGAASFCPTFWDQCPKSSRQVAGQAGITLSCSPVMACMTSVCCVADVSQAAKGCLAGRLHMAAGRPQPAAGRPKPTAAFCRVPYHCAGRKPPATELQRLQAVDSCQAACSWLWLYLMAAWQTARVCRALMPSWGLAERDALPLPAPKAAAGRFMGRLPLPGRSARGAPPMKGVHHL